MLLEVCCADIDSVKAAVEGGAQRVELCADLECDGLTPSSDLILQAVATGIKVHVLIRPRPGNFVYNEEEVREMENSILTAKRLGAHGVVIGALTEDGDIDVETCQRLVECAEGMNITFHRAFDVCNDPILGYCTINNLGCNRLLTSGQKRSALEGAALIRKLVNMSQVKEKTSGRRFVVMPGAGLSADNVAQLLELTHATEVHGSLRSLVDGAMVTTAQNVRDVLEAANKSKAID